MAKVVYLPLDERPCNLYYPQKLAEMTDINFIVPDKELLGNKKQPAKFKFIYHWLLKQVKDADYLIISLDMLIYGGIVPSRIHSLSYDECIERLSVLEQIKSINPGLEILAFDLVMRVPSYNSDDEEPKYYNDYGEKIYLYGVLTDKESQHIITEDELQKLHVLKSEIPKEILDDYVMRREINHRMNNQSIERVGKNVLDTLIIPLDDNSKYGFSAKEQRTLMLKVANNNLYDRVFIYPGADEVGCSLLARVFCKEKKYQPKMFIQYSSTNGPFVIPALEDRSLSESVKSQISTAGGICMYTENNCDIALLINSPPIGQEDMAQFEPIEERHRSYFNEIHYMSFIEKLDYLHDEGVFIALADVATINGSDRNLMEILAKTNRLNKINAYAGWNTSGNTLGTVIAHAIIKSYNNDKIEKDLFLYHRLLEDWAYQSIIRRQITENQLEILEANYFDIAHVEGKVITIVQNQLKKFIKTYIPEFDNYMRIEDIQFPWKRMFEIHFHVKEK